MHSDKITWLRGHCQEGDTCEGVARLSGHDGLYIIARQVTDQATIDGFAHRIGAGEVLVAVTDVLFPKLSPPC